MLIITILSDLRFDMFVVNLFPPQIVIFHKFLFKNELIFNDVKSL